MKREIENILEIEGVNAKGYGIISQAVMFDVDIPIQSKAIYAYFVSYTGSGRTIFPKRETILSDLKMSKNAYYKHLKPLLDNGYIKISKAKGYKNKNVYTICNNPAKVKCFAAVSSSEQDSQLSLDGINANGFGFIPKLIMQDTRLSIKAKGLIAFFYSLVQAGCRAYPHRSTICTFLQISKEVYYNALNQLIEYNYITVKQRHNKNGRFSVNDYILNSNPCQENKDIKKTKENTDKSPCSENCDITDSGLNSKISPCQENEDIIKNNRVGENKTLPCQENCDNNNSTSNNSIFSITPSIQEVSYIPYTQSYDEIRNTIYNLTRFSEYSNKNDEFSRKYCKTIKVLIEMLCEKEKSLYNKQLVSTDKLFDYLNDCITEDIDGLSLRDVIMQTVWHYDLCAEKYNIKQPTQYLKSLLWDEVYNFGL
ncbi:MAG: hypothetical protein J1E85_06350 [Ruminococcus sp.]|nr:hypothetical protein [Ruminococcus sp.]